MKKILAFAVAVVFMAGCATANKMSAIRIGMTKDDVAKAIGQPNSISAQGNSEYLNYALSETGDDAFRGWTKSYYVRLINGKVESYGRTGDFDSTKTPTVRFESEQTVRDTSKKSSDLYSDLVKLKELKDSGVITEEEFQAQKKKMLDSR